MKQFLLAAALTAACGVAAAQGYAGALIGMGKISTDCLGISCDNSKSGFKIYGGYEINDAWSAELSFIDFGELKFTSGAQTQSIKIKGVNVAAAYRYKFTPDLSGVARLGIGKPDIKQSGAITGLTVTADDGVNLYYGLGLEYSIASDFKLIGSLDGLGDASLIGIGAQMSY